MDKIEITRDEFNSAAADVTTEILTDVKLDGMTKALIPLIGLTFASKMGVKLFDEKSDTPEK